MNDESEFNETANEIHDGEKNIVADTVVFTATYDEDPALSASILMIKDIEGVERTIHLPLGFIQKLVDESRQFIDGEKSGNDDNFERFAKAFRCYFEHKVSDDYLREIYDKQAVCFVSSSKEISDRIVNAVLSADLIDE